MSRTNEWRMYKVRVILLRFVSIIAKIAFAIAVRVLRLVTEFSLMPCEKVFLKNTYSVRLFECVQTALGKNESIDV